ncbi:unnamed protein product [Leuciscus chuanchicus]
MERTRSERGTVLLLARVQISLLFFCRITRSLLNSITLPLYSPTTARAPITALFFLVPHLIAIPVVNPVIRPYTRNRQPHRSPAGNAPRGNSGSISSSSLFEIRHP